MSEATSNKATKPAVSANGGETTPKPWFIVAKSSSGNIVKKEAETSEGLLETCGRSELAWVDYWTEDFDKDALSAATEFGFSDSLISAFLTDFRITYQDFDSEMGIRLPAIQVKRFEVTSYPLLLLLQGNFILTIHPLTVDRRFRRLRRYSDTVLKRIPMDIPPEDRLTLLLIRIIDENNDRNFDHLRQIEERGDEVHDSMLNPRTSRDEVGREIYQMKHALMAYLNGLWVTVDVLHALRYGEAELITNSPNLLDKMTVLAEDVNRQIALGEHMSEVLASGLEVLQSIYNNQLQALNNRLAMVVAYLTIIGTAVLVPNTLATIFSHPAFEIGPEDVGWYIALLVGSTILATGLAYWWIKKKGWLPKRPD